jgi:hypothetical protein
MYAFKTVPWAVLEYKDDESTRMSIYTNLQFTTCCYISVLPSLFNLACVSSHPHNFRDYKILGGLC